MRTLILLVVLLAAPRLHADEAMQQELKQRFDECTRGGYVLTEEQGRRLQSSLNVWKLKPEDLPPESATHLCVLQVMAALAQGNAEAARAPLAAQQQRAPDDSQTHRLAYLVASATGDAPTGEAALRALSKEANRQQKRNISRKRRGMRMVGQQAPDVRFRSSDLVEFNPSQPDQAVLVLQFWKMKDLAEQNLKPLRALADQIAETRGAVLVGVNSDDEADVPAAKAFARDNQLEWKQRYEGQSRKAPVTDEAFRVPRPGWIVVIDGYGYVRAIGDPEDPGLPYAIRAAAAEGAGTYPRVLPTARDGSQPEVRHVDDNANAGRDAEREEPKVGVLRDDPNAEAKLRRARLLMRTGQRGQAKKLYEEIVAQHPGTIQARKAAQALDGLP